MATDISFIYELKMEHSYHYGEHTHPNTELVFYTKAGGSVKIGDTEYAFQNGSVAVINSQTVHSETHNIPFEIIFLTFRFDNFTIPNGVYRPKNFAALERIAKQILFETKSPKYGHTWLVSAKIDELMVSLMREILNNKTDSTLHECMLYIEANCHEDIDIRSLSESYGIGYESFRHKFKKLYGMSPKSFMISRRLLKSSDMLLKTDLSCTEIAYDCGFFDSAQFSKLFKRQYGVSPLEFRDFYKH